MPAQSVEILVVTAVWGDWHIRAFLDMNLPTLLAPGNFPALFEKHRGTYRIYTRSIDASRIRNAPTFQQLSVLIPVSLEILDDAESLHDPIATHVKLWRGALAEATEAGKLALLMPPDVLWSDGSFGHIAELLGRGKRGIYSAFVRVTSNSFISDFHRRFGEHPAQVALSGEDLVRLSLEHLHPIMAAHSRTSRYFPYHSEMVVWTVPNEGLAVRVFARELLIYDPSRIKLNVFQLVAGKVPWDELHMVSDSDQLFGVSLTPFGKDASWHRMAWRGTTRDVARWWLDYDSPANDFVAGVELRWHCRPVTEKLWRARKLGADLFTRRAALEREALRVVTHIFREGTGRARQSGRLLALLVVAGRVARAVRGVPRLPTRPIFVFVPEDEAYAGGLLDRCLALLDAADGRAEKTLRAHLAVAPETVDLGDGDALEAVDLDFLDGARRRLIRTGRQWTIGAIVVSGIERASANIVVCYSGAMLSLPRDAAARQPRGRAARRDITPAREEVVARRNSPWM